MESRARRFDVELRNPQTKVKLTTGKPKTDPRNWVEPLKEQGARESQWRWCRGSRWLWQRREREAVAVLPQLGDGQNQ